MMCPASDFGAGAFERTFMEGLDVICAQNRVEQFRCNLAHHEERLSFYSYSLASLRRRRFKAAYEFVYFGFDWSQTTQHSDGTYFGPWRDRRDSFGIGKLLTR